MLSQVCDCFKWEEVLLLGFEERLGFKELHSSFILLICKLPNRVSVNLLLLINDYW